MDGRSALSGDRIGPRSVADLRVKIRPMTVADLDEALVIERASFSQPWTRAMFVGELSENPCSRLFVAETRDGLAGYLGCWVVADEMQVVNLAVRAEARRRGVASRLLRRAFDCAGDELLRAYLEVRRSNRAAIAMYERFGFRRAGVRRGYYTDPKEDALLMEWEM